MAEAEKSLAERRQAIDAEIERSRAASQELLKPKPFEFLKKYDKFKDVTFFSVSSRLDLTLPSYIRSPYAFESSNPHLRAMFGCQGNVNDCFPYSDYVSVIFSLFTSTWTFRGAAIILLVDGERISLKGIEWDGSVGGDGELLETLSTAIPGSTLLKLVRAKRVECQIGLYDFKFSADNFAAVNELATHISPPRER